MVAGGTAPLGYQWQKNGVNIAGATATSYTTPATATTDSGSTFDVVVSNTAGTVTSAAATLTVNAAAVAPTITTQPVNQTVTAGADGDVHGGGGRDGAARLPVAEERSEHRGGDGDELHDASNGDDRQRIDVPMWW